MKLIGETFSTFSASRYPGHRCHRTRAQGFVSPMGLPILVTTMILNYAVPLPCTALSQSHRRGTQKRCQALRHASCHAIDAGTWLPVDIVSGMVQCVEQNRSKGLGTLMYECSPAQSVLVYDGFETMVVNTIDNSLGDGCVDE